MNIKLLTEHHLEFLSLKGGCIGLSESTQCHVKMPHCWKSHVAAQFKIMSIKLCIYSYPSVFFKPFVFFVLKRVSLRLFCKLNWESRRLGIERLLVRGSSQAVTLLCPWAWHCICCVVLVHSRKTPHGWKNCLLVLTAWQAYHVQNCHKQMTYSNLKGLNRMVINFRCLCRCLVEIIFLFLTQNICCGYSKEPSYRALKTYV